MDSTACVLQPAGQLVSLRKTHSGFEAEHASAREATGGDGGEKGGGEGGGDGGGGEGGGGEGGGGEGGGEGGGGEGGGVGGGDGGGIGGSGNVESDFLNVMPPECDGWAPTHVAIMGGDSTLTR